MRTAETETPGTDMGPGPRRWGAFSGPEGLQAQTATAPSQAPAPAEPGATPGPWVSGHSCHWGQHQAAETAPATRWARALTGPQRGDQWDTILEPRRARFRKATSCGDLHMAGEDAACLLGTFPHQDVLSATRQVHAREPLSLSCKPRVMRTSKREEKDREGL